jgi:hypothetical protein
MHTLVSFLHNPVRLSHNAATAVNLVLYCKLVTKLRKLVCIARRPLGCGLCFIITIIVDAIQLVLLNLV